ncbi:MAG: hypothetical protein ACJAVJ_002446, partial [Planctomycetota bacterium]
MVARCLVRNPGPVHDVPYRIFDGDQLRRTESP